MSRLRLGTQNARSITETCTQAASTQLLLEHKLDNSIARRATSEELLAKRTGAALGRGYLLAETARTMADWQYVRAQLREGRAFNKMRSVALGKTTDPSDAP